MDSHTQPNNPTSFDLDLINSIAPPVRLYIAAILAVGAEEPTTGELLIIKALGLDAVEEQHIAFAAYLRRLSIGQPAERLGAYLEPAARAKTLHHAWAAVAWLRSIGESQRLLSNLTLH